ncbi:MAG TPA: hypothetical protein VGT60_01095 [Candidatus Limnocylindria bacterium]|nr:hypothetical protein [Candidatus Limnocylindria bacterium]
MTGDRGQALVLAVLVLALAAVTIVGLEASQERILADARERAAGEAAVEAAGAAVADALLGATVALDAIASDPLVIERARAAADGLSAANGSVPARDLTISVGAGALDVALTVGAHRQRVSIGTACCPR